MSTSDARRVGEGDEAAEAEADSWGLWGISAEGASSVQPATTDVIAAPATMTHATGRLDVGSSVMPWALLTVMGDRSAVGSTAGEATACPYRSIPGNGNGTLDPTDMA
ncbi:hypothetical protein [Salinactinospora qingdaonensis]|uniref:hypothetical protein n=1 Tax=Salinactinospora qingdaonensis TaxID=702744 RepID=UPI0031EFB328